MAINVSTQSEVFWWRPAAWLRVSGEDAAVFLQGQFTNELRNLGTAGAYGLWLNQKGKVLADSFVLPHATAGEFWVGSYFSTGAVIRERLEAYVIADDVVIHDETEAWRGVTVSGAGAGWPEAAEWGAVELPARRGAGEWSEWVFPEESDAAANARWGGRRELSAEEMERRRIEAVIPAVPRDLGPGDLPQEGGLDEGAISYTKGCYLGQEVMARLKAMGQVRRRLLRVRGAGEVPVTPAALWQSGRAVGELRSAVATEKGFVGLAMVQLLHVQREEPLRLGTEGGAEVWIS